MIWIKRRRTRTVIIEINMRPWTQIITHLKVPMPIIPYGVIVAMYDLFLECMLNVELAPVG